MSVLLIAPWGCPAQWRTAYYLIDDQEGKEEACCSLIPLLSHLSKEGRKDITIALIVLDSLIDEYSGKEVESPCHRYYTNRYKEVSWERDAMSYEDLIKRCRVLAENILNDLLEEKRIDKSRVEVRVIVAPCVGSPGGEWTFYGDARDFAAIIIHEIGKLCLERKFDEIIIDLTHGINFMPSICMYLAQLFASLILVAHETEGVKIKVYNSDPYPPRVPKGRVPSLKLNLIVKQEIKSIFIPYILPRNLMRPMRKVDDPQFNEMIKRGEALMEFVQVIISAFYYPIPLALCKSIIELNIDIQQIVDETVNKWRNMISVDTRNMTVERKARLVPEAIYSALLTLSLKGKIMSKLEDLEKPSFKDLRNVASLYKLVHKAHYYLIENEVSRLDEYMTKNYPQISGDAGIPLYELYKDKSESRMVEERCAAPNTRIMIAHGGLQKDFTNVYLSAKIDYNYNELAKCGVKNIRDLLNKAGLLLPRED